MGDASDQTGSDNGGGGGIGLWNATVESKVAAIEGKIWFLERRKAIHSRQYASHGIDRRRHTESIQQSSIRQRGSMFRPLVIVLVRFKTSQSRMDLYHNHDQR